MTENQRKLNTSLFPSVCNCAYTTSGGKNVSLSVDALLAVTEKLPKRPEIFTMDIKLMHSKLIPENAIILGSNVAHAIEIAIEHGEQMTINNQLNEV